MVIRNLFKPFWRRKQRAVAVISPAVAHQMRATLSMVAQTQAQELACDEAHAFLDSYADQVSRGEDAAALPLVHHHLAMCPDCREEFDALLRALEKSTANR